MGDEEDSSKDCFCLNMLDTAEDRSRQTCITRISRPSPNSPHFFPLRYNPPHIPCLYRCNGHSVLASRVMARSIIEIAWGLCYFEKPAITLRSFGMPVTHVIRQDQSSPSLDFQHPGSTVLISLRQRLCPDIRPTEVKSS